MGQQLTYTPAKGELICARVANGESATVIAGDLGISPTTISNWQMADIQGFGGDYARARIQRGEYFGQLVTEIAAGALDGTYEPNAARVAIDAYKWTAGRMTPKVYGDHQHKTVRLEAGEGFTKLLESLDDKTIESTAIDITPDD